MKNTSQPGANEGLSASSDSGTWESKVYALKNDDFDKTKQAEWRGIQKVVKARDKHTCQSCHYKMSLTVHHILPRSEGGADTPPNLITLCTNCHNEIETLGLTNKHQIIDYKASRKYIKQDKTVTETGKATHWQQWVYGGYKRPTHTT